MKRFFIFCGICCFIAIAKLPIDYYTFLRIVICIGALLAIYYWFSNKSYLLAIIFTFIFILFNPVFPIYLYEKRFWIPLDTITGLLFLISAFIKRKERTPVQDIPRIHSKKNYTRDRIISPKNSKS